MIQWQKPPPLLNGTAPGVVSTITRPIDFTFTKISTFPFLENLLFATAEQCGDRYTVHAIIRDKINNLRSLIDDYNGY